MIVLLSGGQDSTTCLHWARGRSEQLDALFVHYGQRHEREYRSAKLIASLIDVPLFEARVEFPFPSALTREVPIDTRPDGLPSTFVAGRNAVFLGLAGGLAKERGHTSVVIGCSGVDYSGYPDCRPAFIADQQRALGHGLDLPDFQIIAPLIDRTKAQTVRLARALGPVAWTALAISWTCYLGGKKPCSECPACLLRAKGFAEAGETDPACLP